MGLQHRLLIEVVQPKLKVHPFFDRYQLHHPALFAELVIRAKEVALTDGEDTFVKGEQCDAVHIYIHGVLKYTEHYRDSKLIPEMYYGRWISEPALWLTWLHRGTLVAGKTAIVLRMEVTDFQAWMSEDYASFMLASQFAQQHA